MGVGLPIVNTGWRREKSDASRNKSSFSSYTQGLVELNRFQHLTNEWLCSLEEHDPTALRSTTLQPRGAQPYSLEDRGPTQ